MNEKYMALIYNTVTDYLKKHDENLKSSQDEIEYTVFVLSIMVFNDLVIKQYNDILTLDTNDPKPIINDLKSQAAMIADTIISKNVSTKEKRYVN